MFSYRNDFQGHLNIFRGVISTVTSNHYRRYSFRFPCLRACNLLLSALPVSTLTRPAHAARNKMAACDAVCVTIKWSGKEYSIDKLSPTDTVGYLKEVIKEKTGVLPERQKLLGLKYKGKKKKLVAINIW